MSNLDLKIPVPFVILATALAMGVVAYWGTLPIPVSLSWRLACALMLVMASLFVLASCTRLFSLFKTTWLPMRPEKATALVTNGIYRYSRNLAYIW